MPLIQKSESLLDGANHKLQAIEKTVSTAVNILNGKSNVSVIEMNLKLSDTLKCYSLKSVFKGEEKETIAFGVVKVLVGRFMESFGFSTKTTDIQLDTITVDTLENFQNDSLEDIILFFKMARTGKLGSTNRGVDSNLIFGDWFPKYLELKADAREKQYTKEKDSFKNESLSIEDVHRAYKKQMNSGQKYWDKVKERIDEITKGFNRQQLEDLISEWEKDESKKKFMDSLRRKRLDIKGDYKF